jgi:hypothetical protein
MTFRVLAELLTRSIVGSFFGIIISLTISLCIMSLIYDFSLNDVQDTIVSYQYGLAIAYVVMVVLVLIEQIAKVQRQKRM